MRNILILIILISGLIFTSFIKNKTRLLEKKLIYLDDKINSLNSNLREANLDFQYLTTPKHISSLAKDFLDENFSYYKESQIKKLINLEKNSPILKKLKNDNTFSQLISEESVNKKSNIEKKIDNKQLQQSKEITVSKDVHHWLGLQIVKLLIGIPTTPVK